MKAEAETTRTRIWAMTVPENPKDLAFRSIKSRVLVLFKE